MGGGLWPQSGVARGGRRRGPAVGLPALPPLQRGPTSLQVPPLPVVQDVRSHHTGSGVSGLQWTGGQLQVGQGAPWRWAAGRGTRCEGWCSVRVTAPPSKIISA